MTSDFFIDEKGNSLDYQAFEKKMMEKRGKEYNEYLTLTEWYNIAIFRKLNWFYEENGYDRLAELWKEELKNRLQRSIDKRQAIELLIQENEFSVKELRSRNGNGEKTGYSIALKGQLDTILVWQALSLRHYSIDSATTVNICKIDENWQGQKNIMLEDIRFLKSVCAGYNRALRVYVAKNELEKIKDKAKTNGVSSKTLTFQNELSNDSINPIETLYSLLEEKFNTLNDCIELEADRKDYSDLIEKLNSLPPFELKLIQKDIRINTKVKNKEELNYYTKSLKLYLRELEQNIYDFVLEYIYLSENDENFDSANDQIYKYLIQLKDECVSFKRWVEHYLEVFTDEGDEDITTPEFEYITQKIAWLHELGILKTVLDQCKENDVYVWRRAATIIQSFTGINADTIRKALQAIFQPNDSNKKNNPLLNSENKLFVANMAKIHKLNKNKES